VGRGYRRSVPGNVAAIVRAVAGRLGEHLDARTGVMTSMFVDVIPEYRHDDEIRRMTVASTTSNLASVVDMLAQDLMVDDIAVPAAAAESARRFAQHELSLEALLRAYRLGEHMFVQWAIADIAALCPPTDVALAAISHIAVLTNNYIDGVTERIIGIYEAERRRWEANPGGARAVRLRTVLRDQDIDLRTAEQMLGVSLGGWHLAMIVWTAPDTPHSTEILRGAVGGVAHAAKGVPLTAVIDGHSWWAWISTPSKPTLGTDRLDADLRPRRCPHRRGRTGMRTRRISSDLPAGRRRPQGCARHPSAAPADVARGHRGGRPAGGPASRGKRLGAKSSRRSHGRRRQFGPTAGHPADVFGCPGQLHGRGRPHARPQEHRALSHPQG
jgi:hypothetical protein